MAHQPKRVYRSDEGVLGGVCAGFAERFDLDAALVRLLAILLSVVTAGVCVLLYGALWLVLPDKPTGASALDVDPASFRSEVYDQVVKRPDAPAPAASAPAAAPVLPPTPPSAASAYYTVRVEPTPAAPAVPRVSESAQSVSNAPVAAGLVAGIILILAGVAAFVSRATGRFEILQFWPVLVVALGVVRIVMPAKDGSRATTTWLGALVVVVGLVALASSLGFYEVDTTVWVARAVPFLVLAVGLLIMGRASHSDVLILCAGVCLVLFLIVGAYYSLEEVSLEAGLTRSLDPDAVLQFDGEQGS